MLELDLYLFIFINYGAYNLIVKENNQICPVTWNWIFMVKMKALIYEVENGHVMYTYSKRYLDYKVAQDVTGLCTFAYIYIHAFVVVATIVFTSCSIRMP